MSVPKIPLVRVTPETVVRTLMGNIDRVGSIYAFVQYKDKPGIVTTMESADIGTGTLAYYGALINAEIVNAVLSSREGDSDEVDGNR